MNQSEESKKRMEVEEDAMVERWRKSSYPAALGFKRYGFREGYIAGMQDPEVNSERIKQLEEELDLQTKTCDAFAEEANEKDLKIGKLEGFLEEYERFFENQTRDLEKLIQPERYLFEAKELLQKLKAAKERVG